MNTSLAFVLEAAWGQLWFQPLYVGRRSGPRDRVLGRGRRHAALGVTIGVKSSLLF
jgi:hypothetical protein